MAGIDFDKLDAEEKWQLRQEQEDDAEIAMSFLSVDEKTIESELTGFCQRVDDFCKHLKSLIDNRDFTTTDDMMKALWMNDLGDGGWIRTYTRKNGTTLGYKDGRLDISDYDSDEINCLNTGREYIDELYLLADICYHCSKMLRTLPLKSSYDRLCWCENFIGADFDDNLFSRIDTAIDTINWQLSRTNEIPSGRSADYAAFYALKIRELSSDKSKVIDEYYKRRIQDYQDDLKKRGLHDCIKEKKPGEYEVIYKWSSEMEVIDNYTNILTRQDPIEDKMRDLNKECTRIRSEIIRPKQSQMKHNICQYTCSTLDDFVQTVQRYTSMDIQSHEDFQEAKEAPYCFMKNPPSLETVTERYSFKPSKASPWEHGTSLKDCFRMAAEALTDQCWDFVYNKPLPSIFK